MRANEKRNEARLLCAELVKVTSVDDVGQLSRDVANLDDASSLGACLVVTAPIQVGSAIVVTCHGLEFNATVRHCTAQESGWSVGVEFDSDASWDLEVNKLKHLVDPAQVTVRSNAHQPAENLPDISGMVSCLALSLALVTRTNGQR